MVAHCSFLLLYSFLGKARLHVPLMAMEVAIMHSVFVYHTTDFTKVYEFEKSKRGPDYMAHYFYEKNEIMANKYYLGTALLMLPFFLLAWVYSWFLHIPADGYNFLFQYAVSLAAAVYLAIGLVCTARLLQSFGFGKKVQSIVVLALVFATNLFYYAFLHPSHSHVYSFAAISVFLLYSRYFFVRLQGRFLFLSAAMLGLITLIRPTNALIMLSLPMLAGSKQSVKQAFDWLLKKALTTALAALLLLSIIALQAVFQFIQSGEIFYWSYQNEGFNFGHPAIFRFLFGFRKGFFIYTPLMFFLFPGLFFMARHSRYGAIWFMMYLSILLVVLSAWWNWFYGDSFGMRAMIDHYAALAIPLAWFVQHMIGKKWSKIALYLLLSLVVLLNLIQTRQYQSGILHPDSMSWEKYRYVFLKTGQSYRNVLGEYPEAVFETLNEEKKLAFFNAMDNPVDCWTTNGILKSDLAFSGNALAVLDRENIYSPTLELPKIDAKITENQNYVRVGLMYNEPTPNAAAQALLVYAVNDSLNRIHFYKTFKIKQMPDGKTGQWRKARFGFRVPAIASKRNQVKIYIWNREPNRFFIDDFDISIYPLSP